MSRNEDLGLCQTCMYAADCALTKARGLPVLQCEEFEAERDPRVKARSGVVASTEPGVDAALDVNLSGKYKGLCVDCENRDSCTFPKSEGGVWHCEEYR